MKQSHTTAWLWPAAKSSLIAIASVAIVSASLGALSSSDSQGGSYVVFASVQPARYIVVNNDLQIQKIISNTVEDVIPYVSLQTLDGNPVPYTESIRSQYQSLKPSLNFSKAGTVYSRRFSGSVGEASHLVVGSVLRFIFG